MGSNSRWKRPASPTCAMGSTFSGFTCNWELAKLGSMFPKSGSPGTLKQCIRRLNEAMRWRPTQQSGAARLVRGSAVVPGWSNYYRIAHDFSSAANRWTSTLTGSRVKALCRRYDITTAQCIRKYGRGDKSQHWRKLRAETCPRHPDVLETGIAQAVRTLAQAATWTTLTGKPKFVNTRIGNVPVAWTSKR